MLELGQHYRQKRAISAVPSALWSGNAGQVPPTSVRGWLLPWVTAHALRLRQAYQERGVRDMYPWQATALECGEGGGNLVYCAPTSGGKSLVAEVLLLRRLLAASGNTRRRGRKVPGTVLQAWSARAPACAGVADRSQPVAACRRDMSHTSVCLWSVNVLRAGLTVWPLPCGGDST